MLLEVLVSSDDGSPTLSATLVEVKIAKHSRQAAVTANNAPGELPEVERARTNR